VVAFEDLSERALSNELTKTVAIQELGLAAGVFCFFDPELLISLLFEVQDALANVAKSQFNGIVELFGRVTKLSRSHFSSE
jgi:hypothetical protein